MPHVRLPLVLLAGACLGSAAARAAAPPSVVVEAYHDEGSSGTVTLEVDDAPPCVIVLKGDGKYREACTIPVPAAAKEIRLSGEVRWKHWKRGKQVSKGTQSWRILDIGSLVAPLRDTSRPYGSRVQDLLAARPAFEKGTGELVEEGLPRVEAGEKSAATAVADAEKRLGFALPGEYASLVTGSGALRIDDSGLERPERLARAVDQMVKDWETPREGLLKELAPAAMALYRTGTILFTEVGDGYGGLLYRPAPVPECGGKAAHYWFHQDEINRLEVLKDRDGSCRDFPAAFLRVLGEHLFQQYDDTGDAGVVVDRSSPAPFLLKLHHDGDTPGPGFTLRPDWSRFE